MLSHDQRTRLLRIARESIEAVLHGRRPELDHGSLDETLTRPSGAFVSLHTKDGNLRGCIGSIHAVSPLCVAVSTSAINAAFRDPRFFPLRREELENVGIEISVLSPIEAVASAAEIVVGRDGVIISHGSRAALLLPQVAVQFGWDCETFLRQTCIKAGLSSEIWRSAECRVERFSAEVFSEQVSEQ